MTSGRKYSDVEVRAIIDHALDNESPRDVSHEELVKIASEVGLSPESIEKAARDVEVLRATDSAKLSVISRRRRHLVSHAGTFLIVNLFLFAVNFLTTPGQWWVAFPIAIWGLALVFHARAALSRHVSEGALLREQRRMGGMRATVQEQGTRGKRVRLEVEPERSSEVDPSQNETLPSEPTQQRRGQER